MPAPAAVRVIPEPAASEFRLEVEDSGIGIAPEDIHRLFVEFQQLDAGAAKRHSGTGLGLALTKRLVEAQGGHVGVCSVPGKGSTFHAVLPRQAAGGLTMIGSAAIVPLATGTPTVLVIEDQAHDQAQLAETLRAAGYGVDTVSTGSQAVEKARQRSYDAITLDLVLPDMNGIQVLQAIRSQESNRDVPVIVVTVVAERGAIAAFAVHDILPKPLDGEQLLRSLERAGVVAGASREVLVVDDDVGSLKLMAATLSQLGYRASCAPGAAEGLRLARESPPLAVVLDLIMPGIDGFEFLDQFRTVAGCRRTPVIVWTVKDLSDDEYARLRLTAQAVVAKGRGGSSGVVDELRTFLPPVESMARKD